MSDGESDLTPEQQRVKEAFVESRGYWSERWQNVLELDPKYLERYLDFSAHPWREGVLDPKIREFIYIAIDTATTHLHAPGARVHIGNALDHGATVEEIMEVFQLASVLGIHSVTDGVPILIDEGGPPELSDEEQKELTRVRKEFEQDRGYWSDRWEQVASLDPEYFEHYKNFSAHPWREGVLDPKVREFIYIAIDLSTTHLHKRGARIHIQNALEHGATQEEIMEVIELISVLGIHTITDNVPILIEEAQKRGKLPDDD